MKELQSNKLYTNSQIAEWFGFKTKRFASKEQKEKKLEELKLFADYQLVGNKTKKIYIKQVYEPVYSKKGSQSFQIVNENLEMYWNDHGKGLDTCKRVGEAMYKDKITTLSEKSTINYTNKSKREKYGKNFLTVGDKGYSIYAWGKYVQNEQTGELSLVPLTKEEEEVKDKLIKKYFGNTTDKQIFVQAMVDEGEITKEEAWEVLEELTNMKDKFRVFKAEFEVAINSVVGRGTYLIATNEEKESAF